MSSEDLSRLEESEEARELLPDDVWEEVKGLLPPRARNPKGGRHWKGNRDALCGILYVLKMNISWEYLPAELFGLSGMTCWRRLREWVRVGAWDELRPRLEKHLGGQDKIDWARALIDSKSALGSKTPSE